MRAHGEEANQLGLPEERRVDHHVIEMLAADLRVIDQKDIAAMDVFQPINIDAILHRHAEVGEKNRQRTFILRQGPAFVIDDADAVILHLVDHHVIGGLFQHRRHLVGGCFQSAANDFHSDRIDSHG